MAEPTSSTAAGAALGWKLLGLSALLGSGILGAVMMAVFDPPKTKKLLFGQAAVAGIGSLFFGPVATKLADHYFDFINLANATGIEAFEVAAPVYLLVGAMSWGAFGALAKFREIIRTRGAENLANKTGIQ